MSSRSWACPLCALLGALVLGVLAWAWLGRGDDLAAQVRQRSEADAAQILTGAGFPWARLQIDDEVGRVVGEAPSLVERAAAFAAAGSLLMPMMGSPGVFARLVDAQSASLPGLLELPATAGGTAASRGADPAEAASDPLSATRCESEIAALLRGESLRFGLGSAELSADSASLIRRLKVTAQRCPSARFRIEGHTDTQGDARANQRLSEQRAQAVLRALVRAGVPSERLRARGYGASRPAVAAETPEAHERNRRIEIHLVSEPG